MMNRSVGLERRMLANEEPAAARYILTYPSVTPVERCLLWTSMVALPLQNSFPTVAGVSSSFLLFAALFSYVIVNRPRILGEIWYHPVFIAAYAFIGVAILLEFSSPLSRYQEVIRFAQMIGGAVCVAVLCRDRSGLTTGLYGCIGTALWVSVVLYLTSYGMLQGMGPTSDFHEASNLRGGLDTGIKANLNGLAFMCAQGAIVAFALSLSDRFKYFRILLLGIGIFCLVAAFLPMSRGAAVITAVSVATVLYAHGVKQGKALILVSILGLGIYVFVPEAVWSRMTFSTATSEGGKMEGRAYIYTTALNRLPEYVVAGVGAGNFFGKWGFDNGFFRDSGNNVLGAHNTFLQVTIFWGVFGLFMFMLMLWLIYRAIPLRCGRDGLSLALLGILVSLGMVLLESHQFWDKWFSFGLGMLIGARRWIWPTGIVSPNAVTQSSSYEKI
ncbi:MAG: O-antigen ligase family protein [Nitrospira sp.]|nr:O-antigen ligase family protein [Nitrospira sp.]